MRQKVGARAPEYSPPKKDALLPPILKSYPNSNPDSATE